MKLKTPHPVARAAHHAIWAGPLVYLIVIWVMASTHPERAAWWFSVCLPLTDALRNVLPILDNFSGQLASHGYHERIPIVVNVIAINSLIAAVAALIALGYAVAGLTVIIKGRYTREQRRRALIGLPFVAAFFALFIVHGLHLDFRGAFRNPNALHLDNSYFLYFVGFQWAFWLSVILEVELLFLRRRDDE